MSCRLCRCAGWIWRRAWYWLGNSAGAWAARLGIPVYLYEEAATRPERVNLADIRHGEYEGLKAEIASKP